MDVESSGVGLVLSGGGARGAYQAGVLCGIAELVPEGIAPFQVLTGASAGAINAMAIASAALDYRGGATRLWNTWANLRAQDVFRTDAGSIGKIGAKWLRDLSLGGCFDQVTSTHLLDTAPLRELLDASIAFSHVTSNVEHGFLGGVAVTATDYASSTAVTFYHSNPPSAPWSRTGRVGRPSRIGLEHVMASSAIPLFFPPERIEGRFYGDGCVRLTAPLSPAIHLGAARLLAIGVRHERSGEIHSTRAPDLSAATVADVGGALLNAVFLDGLGTDLERLERINQTLVSVRPLPGNPSALRHIPVLALRPSKDLREFASEEFDELPPVLKYMLGGVGVSREKGWDVVSYLAFDRGYTRRLLDLGYQDAIASGDVIRAFLDPADGVRLASGA